MSPRTHHHASYRKSIFPNYAIYFQLVTLHFVANGSVSRKHEPTLRWATRSILPWFPVPWSLRLDYDTANLINFPAGTSMRGNSGWNLRNNEPHFHVANFFRRTAQRTQRDDWREHYTLIFPDHPSPLEVKPPSRRDTASVPTINPTVRIVPDLSRRSPGPENDPSVRVDRKPGPHNSRQSNRPILTEAAMAIPATQMVLPKRSLAAQMADGDIRFSSSCLPSARLRPALRRSTRRRGRG